MPAYGWAGGSTSFRRTDKCLGSYRYGSGRAPILSYLGAALHPNGRLFGFRTPPLRFRSRRTGQPDRRVPCSRETGGHSVARSCDRTNRQHCCPIYSTMTGFTGWGKWECGEFVKDNRAFPRPAGKGDGSRVGCQQPRVLRRDPTPTLPRKGEADCPAITAQQRARPLPTAPFRKRSLERLS